MTAAMVLRFAELYCLSVHMLWEGSKIACFTPAEASMSVCFWIKGDHAFFVDDPQTKSVIAKMSTIRPRMRKSVVLKVLTKNSDPPASEWAEWSGEIAPGHYYADDLPSVRLDLHSRGLCPLVQLSGIGTQKALRLKTRRGGDVVIHRRPQEAFVCEDFAAIYEKRTGRKLVYHGESMASFCNKAFAGLMKPPGDRRPFRGPRL